MAIDLTIKSNRLLQSRRYTQNQQADSQEAFTRVFDLNASEIYTQQDLIPSSSLPYSGSTQNGLTSGVIKFYYRQRLTPSDQLDNGNYNTFFFINPTASIDFTNGIGAGTLNPNQQGNFISPKYAPTLPNETENISPGYKVTLTNNVGALINPTLYTFDYKTGVLQYSASSGFATIPSAQIYLTAYQYIGSTLASLSTDLTASYAITASYAMNGGGGPSTPAFPYNGTSTPAVISGSLIVSGSGIIITGSLNAPDITGSLQGTSSWANNVLTASYVTGSIYNSTNPALSASYALTASYALNGGSGGSTFPYNGTVTPAIISGSLIVSGSGITVTGSVIASSFTGSLQGTSSWANNVLTSSYVNTLNQNVIITGSLAVGTSSLGPNENTITLGARDTTNEGGQIGFNAPGGTYTSASFLDLYQNRLRVLRGTNAGSVGEAAWWSMHNLQMALPAYTTTTSFPGSPAGYLAFDSSGNIITVAGGVGPTVPGGTSSQIQYNSASIFQGLSTLTYDGTTLRATGSFTGSLTGSLFGTASYVTGSVHNSSNPALSASYALTASYALNGGSGGPSTPGFPFSGSAVITGSLYMSGGALLNSPDNVVTNKYALKIETGSGAIWSNNINVGTPTSNNWNSGLTGSYFNNFTQNTDVSEILRFIAGLLSQSAPDASPNTRTYNNFTTAVVNSGTSSTIAGTVPSSSSNLTVLYLQAKGFANSGSTIFSGSTIQTNFTYGNTYTSATGSTTTVSSSVNTFGLGPLSSGAVTNFKVSGSFTFRYKDNSAKTDTATSSSQTLITVSSETTSQGVTLAKVPTINAAVIPAAYQDGKYASIMTTSLYSGSVIGSGGATGSGWYHISSSIAIASGSSAYTPFSSSNVEVFWAPLTAINANIPAQTITTGSTTITALTAVSRSLSGAPYLSGSTYSISSSLNNLFNPLYAVNILIASMSSAGVALTMAGSTLSASISSSGLIATSNTIWNTGSTVVRSINTVPAETDIAKLNAVTTFAPTTQTNISQTGIGSSTFTLSVSGYNKTPTVTTYANTVNYHTAGTFGQPTASGSLAYYGRAQGYDGSSTTSENFSGEGYRIQLTNNVLSFTGTAWSTAYGVYNLGNIDLQVKPSYLVKPGGTYKYWLNNPSSASNYKYYIRKFTTDGAAKTSMTLNCGTALETWTTSGAGGIAALILFESSNNTIYTPARLYDPTELTSNFIATKTANTDGQNPFGVNFGLYGNTGGSLSTTTYTIPLRSADGMVLDTTYTNLYVLIRYNSDPTPLSSITVTFS